MDRDRNAQLAALIAEQATDGQQWRIRHRRVDSDVDVGSLADHRRPVGLVGLDLIWTPAVVGYDPRDGDPCPACGGRPPWATPCLVCSATGGDPRRAPMQDRSLRAAILAGPAAAMEDLPTTRRRRRAVARAG